jgi:predicted DsbA family dithiol-disulfide isomerase
VVDEKTEGRASEAVQDRSVRPRILVFFDYACPFCYVDRPRFDRLASDHDAEVVLVPFELRPSIPPDGVSAAAEGLGHSEKVEEYLIKAAEREGMAMVLPDHVPHTRLAMTMAEVARDAGLEPHHATHVALFDAYFGRGLDIGNREILLDAAERVGLPPEDVVAAWLEDRYGDRFRGFHQVTASLGIDAVPAALICNRLLIGSRPYKVLEAQLEECLVTREKAEASAAGVARAAKETQTAV